MRQELPEEFHVVVRRGEKGEYVAVLREFEGIEMVGVDVEGLILELRMALVEAFGRREGDEEWPVMRVEVED